MESADDDVFQIIATYFANTYWNNIYATAVNAFQEGRLKPQPKNMGEAYYRILDQYTRAISALDLDGGENKHYIHILTDMFKQYGELLQITNFVTFKNLLVKPFIPPDMFSNLPSMDAGKDNLFKKILIQVLTEFTVYINKNGITVVVNDRQNGTKYLNVWRDQFIDFLKLERTKLRNQFLAQKNGVDINKQNVADVIPREVADALQERIKVILKEKYDLEVKYNKLAAYTNKLKEIVKENESRLSKFSKSEKPDHRKYDKYEKSESKRSESKKSEKSEPKRSDKSDKSDKSEKSEKKELTPDLHNKQIPDPTRHIDNVGTIAKDPLQKDIAIDGEQLSVEELSSGSEESGSENESEEYESPSSDE